MKWTYLAFGLVLTATATIGAFIPLLPTVPFLIGAAWCFGKSSPRLEAWLYQHPRFGPLLRQWSEQGAIDPYAKTLAILGMLLSLSITFLLKFEARILLIQAAVLLPVACYLLTRPSPRKLFSHSPAPVPSSPESE